ncbi:hypothetical protein T492DRAFT_1112925 [Pavlovales sp. CCMP2436]|nr:hypothetical protein T492DRAFT_1112925 [Pavlovales sp. CCMP2436]
MASPMDAVGSADFSFASINGNFPNARGTQVEIANASGGTVVVMGNMTCDSGAFIQYPTFEIPDEYSGTYETGSNGVDATCNVQYTNKDGTVWSTTTSNPLMGPNTSDFTDNIIMSDVTPYRLVLEVTGRAVAGRSGHKRRQLLESLMSSTLALFRVRGARVELAQPVGAREVCEK